MFYHCFSLTIEQLPNQFFFFFMLWAADPRGLLSVKSLWNAAHNLCLLNVDLLRPNSIYLWVCFCEAVYSEGEISDF